MILSNFIGILVGPIDLEGFEILIRSLTSITVSGVRNNELQALLGKWSRGDFRVNGIVFVIPSATLT